MKTFTTEDGDTLELYRDDYDDFLTGKPDSAVMLRRNGEIALCLSAVDAARLATELQQLATAPA